MFRRDFLALTAGVTLTAALPLRAGAAPLAYTPGLVKERLAAGETVFLDFKASWCTTCAAQEKVLTKLKAETPAYEEQITFVDVDWDEYGRGALAKELRIPRRSTLVVLRGEEELGRLVAQTQESQIKGLLDIALTAATA